MAPELSLTVRISPSDSFQVSIEEDESVEALVAIILSMRPDLGEDLRIAHKGRPLRPEQQLLQAGVASNDAVAVARKPKEAVSKEEPAAAPAAEAGGSPSAEVKEPSSEEPPLKKQAVEATSEESSPVSGAAPCDAQGSEAQGAPETSPKASEEVMASPAPAASASEAEAAAPEAERQSTECPVEASEAAKEEEQPATSSLWEGLSEMPPSAAILAVIQRFEQGGADEHPGELLEALRRTAARVEGLERAVGESSQALMLVNHLSAKVLQGLGHEGGGANATNLMGQEREEAPRSFLIKKGDGDLQEAHRNAAQRAAERRSPQGSYGGTLSSSASPMTKEEMDKARQARLEKLEAQQALRKKEQEEAAARAKAKDAIFNSPFAGAGKPLGKH